ncbi:hypothetical protein VHEMI03293 [[Torrubiella] hemipterigena]|uniref:Uncharacterized protein n=1 Tax=[Torrubiella] hemipterigena TaxID=1531966 RepID=A0A0A1TAS7_9HYPO|nr:hypothetical protein VHEMI03293 [[Torrubiella] hemipterigena]
MQFTVTLIMALASAVCATPANLTPKSAQSGPCAQGDCPDNNSEFDMVYTNESGNTSDYIRVKDGCTGNCFSHFTGGGGGGCSRTQLCGRWQNICVDPTNGRASRHFEDTNETQCFDLDHQDLGACPGTNIFNRQVFRPINQRGC